jgi:histidine ammonia-lyase
MPDILLGHDHLSIEKLIEIIRKKRTVDLSPESKKTVLRSRKVVEDWVREGRVIYGITTGFGALCNVMIPPDDAVKLQKNILLSHSAGVGMPLEEEIVRGVMGIRINDLSKGYGAIRLETLEALANLLNADVCPIVPEKGSVGASGDLAPMSHLALVLIGLGEAFYKGKRLPGAEALNAAGLMPIQLEAGEGLTLINGTQVMTSIAALAVYDALRLAKTADIACGISLEVLMCTNAAFDPKIHKVRPHPGQSEAARNMERITRGSEIISSHKDCSRIQDAYTLRCSPQIHGASRDAIHHVRGIVETEINSTTTNPLIFCDTDEVLLGGNFHGQPIALAADYLTIALSEFASVSERRIERLVNPQLSGLPAFLIDDSGLNSGFMLGQYTAAALVSENKVLSHPASVDSIPTSANKEDHVSMGTIAARKCRSVLKNAEYVIAIEMLCACQAMDLLTKGRPGSGTEEAYRTVREVIPRMDHDRYLAGDIEKMADLIRSGQIINRVEGRIGQLE